MSERPGEVPNPITAAQLMDEFSRAAKTLERRFDERVGAHRVSAPRSRVLSEVLKLEPVKVRDLAAAVGISQGTASVLIDALAKDGLVERLPDPSDRRVTLVALTDAGHRASEAWQRDYEAAAAEMLSSFPRQDWSRLATMLRSLSGTTVGAEASSGPTPESSPE